MPSPSLPICILLAFFLSSTSTSLFLQYFKNIPVLNSACPDFYESAKFKAVPILALVSSIISFVVLYLAIFKFKRRILYRVNAINFILSLVYAGLFTSIRKEHSACQETANSTLVDPTTFTLDYIHQTWQFIFIWIATALQFAAVSSGIFRSFCKTRDFHASSYEDADGWI